MSSQYEDANEIICGHYMTAQAQASQGLPIEFPGIPEPEGSQQRDEMNDVEASSGSENMPDLLPADALPVDSSSDEKATTANVSPSGAPRMPGEKPPSTSKAQRKR